MSKAEAECTDDVGAFESSRQIDLAQTNRDRNKNWNLSEHELGIFQNTNSEIGNQKCACEEVRSYEAIDSCGNEQNQELELELEQELKQDLESFGTETGIFGTGSACEQEAIKCLLLHLLHLLLRLLLCVCG
jgi:hypothetical protein